MTSSELIERAVEWRRHLHANPELSFEERETSAFVEQRLREIGGLEIQRPTPTSVVACLRSGPGQTLALRADMDALPITEQSGVPFTSTRPGVMHACGHDMHTATLLAVAQVLVDRRSELAGEVRFVFQHAEEVPPGEPPSSSRPALWTASTLSWAHMSSRTWSEPRSGSPLERSWHRRTRSR